MLKFLKLITSEKYRFLTSAISLIFCFFVALFIYLSYLTHNSEFEKAILSNSTLALAVEQSTEGRIKTAEIALDQMIYELTHEDRHFPNLDPVEISRLLNQEKKIFKTFELLAVINKDGDVIYSSHWDNLEKYKNRKSINVIDRPYFQIHKNNINSGLVISKPQISKTLGSQIITVNKRIPSSDNSFIGIVSVTINLKLLTDALANITKDQNLTLSILNNERLIVARFPFKEEHIGKFVPKSKDEDISLNKNKLSGHFTDISPVDNKEKIISFKKLENYPLTIYVGRNTESIFLDWRRAFYTISFLGLVLTIIIIFFLFKYFEEHQKLEMHKILTMNSARMSSLGLMAASVAHEINNPLTIIIGRASQSLRALESKEIEVDKLKKSFGKIIETSLRMAKIISGIKVIARDGSQDKFEKVSLKEILNHVGEYVDERFNLGGVVLKIINPPDIYLNCREGQIIQVLVNLLNNAFDACELLEESWVHVTFTEINAKKIQIIVTDSGLGISPMLANQIMNPFNTTKPASKGTGLGLYISTKIIKEHSGQVFVNHLNKNTSFIVELPLARQSKS